MPRLALILPAALLLLAGPARADWSVTEMPTDEGGTTLAAESYSRSGEGRLSVGCTPEDVLYVGLEYVGHVTAAERLRVAYRVDGRGSIQGRWPTSPADGALRVYNTTDVYVDEMIRRVRQGTRLRVDIELLPHLVFDLAGSEQAVATVMQRCGGENPSPVVETGDPAEAEAEEAPPPGPTEPTPPGPGAPTPLVPTE
jgi:hypothetical protein